MPTKDRATQFGKQKPVKKTVGDTTAQGLLNNARIENGALLTRDRYGVNYVVRQTAQGNLSVIATDGGWSAVLRMNDWAKAELAWWEAKLDATTPPQLVYLLLKDGVVCGHANEPDVAAPHIAVHPFRVNNAANRPLPAIGASYAPPPPPVRPKRTRGVMMVPWA